MDNHKKIELLKQRKNSDIKYLCVNCFYDDYTKQSIQKIREIYDRQIKELSVIS